ncbi:hypothetical protein IEO21_08763 [Rhodonia placenta]|uniref:Uncharacterized protein n=1 Tax=Rhodonia placenta TaxID=104341 RepID=A0A8H7NVU9_9APHY|nr:hypothetical protein IEO21_08763 [Postia placenta]
MSVFDLHLDSTLGCGFIGITAGVIHFITIATTPMTSSIYGCCSRTTQIAFLWLLDTVGTVLDAMSRGSLYLALSFPVYVAAYACFSPRIPTMAASFNHHYELSGFAYKPFDSSNPLSSVTVYKLKVNRSIAAGLQDATATGCLQTLTAVLADIYISVLLCMILNGKKTGFRKYDDWPITGITVQLTISQDRLSDITTHLVFYPSRYRNHGCATSAICNIRKLHTRNPIQASLDNISLSREQTLNVRHHLRDSGQHAADKLLSGNILDMIPIDHTPRLPRRIEINANCAKPVLGYIVVNREVIESVDV